MSLQSAIRGLCRTRPASFSQTHYFLEGGDLSSLTSHDRESLRKKLPAWIQSGAVVVLGRFTVNHEAKPSDHYLTALKRNMIQWFDCVAGAHHDR